MTKKYKEPATPIEILKNLLNDTEDLEGVVVIAKREGNIYEVYSSTGLFNVEKSGMCSYGMQTFIKDLMSEKA